MTRLLSICIVLLVILFGIFWVVRGPAISYLLSDALSVPVKVGGLQLTSTGLVLEDVKIDNLIHKPGRPKTAFEAPTMRIQYDLWSLINGNGLRMSFAEVPRAIVRVYPISDGGESNWSQLLRVMYTPEPSKLTAQIDRILFSKVDLLIYSDRVGAKPTTLQSTGIEITSLGTRVQQGLRATSGDLLFALMRRLSQQPGVGNIFGNLPSLVRPPQARQVKASPKEGAEPSFNLTREWIPPQAKERQVIQTPNFSTKTSSYVPGKTIVRHSERESQSTNIPCSSNYCPIPFGVYEWYR